MEQDIVFGRCVDFLARMIEKYGQELINEINVNVAEEEGNSTEKSEPENGSCAEYQLQYDLSLLEYW